MRLTALLTVSVVLLALAPAASPVALIDIPFPLANGLVAHIQLDSLVPFGRFREADGGKTTIWSTVAYEIRISQELSNGINFVRVQMVSSSANAVPVKGLVFRVDAPAAGIDGVWTPSGRLNSETLTSASAGAPLLTHSAANYGIPFVGAATDAGRNVLSLGLLQQDLPVEIRATPNKAVYQFQLAADLPGIESNADYRFFVQRDGLASWFEAAETYADWVDKQTGYSPFPVPETAYQPVYDTWYWSADNVDEHLYLNTAEVAADVGLSMFLADSGWDAPTGEYDRWLMGRTGDYSPPHEKFSNLGLTFAQLRSQWGLGIQLWLQPFAVGRSSVRYEKTRALHVQIPKSAMSSTLAPFALPLTKDTLEDVNLCPRSSATHRYLRDLFIEMSAAYQPEAYWLDFIDAIPTNCVAPHKHDVSTFGAGVRQALSTIRTTLLSVDENPVVQFRAQYANLNNKPFANVWQPFDAPNDFDRMRLDALRLRPFSKGVVFASDQLYWPSDVDDVTVSLFAMTSVMSGVPSIGADLVDSRASHRTIVREWLGFYRKYREDLTQGIVRPFGSFRVPNHKIESSRRAFAYIRTTARAVFRTLGRKEIFLLNASDAENVRATILVSPGVSYEVQTMDRYHQPRGAAMRLASTRGVLDVNAVVERGGYLVLTPQ